MSPFGAAERTAGGLARCHLDYPDLGAIGRVAADLAGAPDDALKPAVTALAVALRRAETATAHH